MSLFKKLWGQASPFQQVVFCLLFLWFICSNIAAWTRVAYTLEIAKTHEKGLASAQDINAHTKKTYSDIVDELEENNKIFQELKVLLEEANARHRKP
jgi:hypothetical protein